MATHSSILAWKISWTQEPGGLQSMESQELDMTQLLRLDQTRLVIAFLSRSKCLLISWLQLASAGEGNGTPLQYSCLENPMDGRAWQAAVHGVAKVRTQLSDFTFTFHFHALEKEMAAHSSILAWRIPGMGEPGGLPSQGLHRVGHD